MKDRVISILQEELGKTVTPESTWDALGVDSLEFVDLIQATEDAFKIRIEDREFDGILTVQDLINLVDSRGAW